MSSSERRASRSQPPAAREGAAPPPSGAYLTDGSSLYHVERTLAEDDGEALLALEDCRTLDVALLPVRAVAAMGLREIRP